MQPDELGTASDLDRLPPVYEIGGGDGEIHVLPISDYTEIEPLVPNRDRWFDTGYPEYKESVAELRKFLKYIMSGSPDDDNFLNDFIEAALSGPTPGSWFNLVKILQSALWKTFRQKKEREQWRKLMTDLIVCTFVMPEDRNHEFIYLFGQVQRFWLQHKGVHLTKPDYTALYDILRANLEGAKMKLYILDYPVLDEFVSYKLTIYKASFIELAA